MKKNKKSERNLLVASLVLLIILLISAQASTNTVVHIADTTIDPLSINHGSIRINTLQPSTPLSIHGYIFYKNGTFCSNPVVNITNMNNGKTWTAKTIETSNYYRIMLASYTDVAALETLQINAISPDECQFGLVEHTVTLAEVETGDLKYNITLESSINHEILSVGSATVDVNDTIVIPVTIANATGIRQVSMDIVYDPESITITNISVNDCIPSSIVSYTLGSGIATIELMNDNITVTNATSLIDITIQAGENSTTTILEPLNVEMTDDLGSHAPFSTVNGSVMVCIKGDFNYNDRVDIGDAAKVAFMVAEKVEEIGRADFNNNGRVDVGDAAKISFYLAHKVSEL